MNDNLNEWFSLLGSEIKLAAQELKDKTDRMRAEGKTVYPPSDKVFAALSAVSPSNVKAVILGQDPYHEPNRAMGLSFSVPEGVKKPRSLNNIFKELEADLGYPAPESGDLTLGRTGAFCCSIPFSRSRSTRQILTKSLAGTG